MHLKMQWSSCESFLSQIMVALKAKLNAGVSQHLHVAQDYAAYWRQVHAWLRNAAGQKLLTCPGAALL